MRRRRFDTIKEIKTELKKVLKATPVEDYCFKDRVDKSAFYWTGTTLNGMKFIWKFS